MRSRPGVSLVETVVAAVLLMLGIGGTMHALAGSARLRSDADAREVLTGLLLDRLAWFEASACVSGDTSGVSAASVQPTLRWRVQAVGTRRVLTMDAVRAPGRRAPRTHIVTSRTCD